MALIFLNKSGGNQLLRGRGQRGISGKWQNTETTAVRKKQKRVRKEKRDGAPRTKLTQWLRKGACRCKAQASQVSHKDEALCPCSSPDTLLGMRRLCRSVYLILIKFDGLWGFSLLGLTRRIPTATPSQTPVNSCGNFPTHTILQVNHPQMSILPYPKQCPQHLQHPHHTFHTGV